MFGWLKAKHLANGALKSHKGCCNKAATHDNDADNCMDDETKCGLTYLWERSTPQCF